MSGKTSIQWTDATWNPVRGCSRISEGCRNCYAERMAARFSEPSENAPDRPAPFWGFAQMTDSGPRWTGRVELIPAKLDEPLRWRKPRRVFVNSMSDLFHESLPDEAIIRVLDVIRQNENRDFPHTMQVLTKRAERMRSIMTRLQFDSAGKGRMFLEDRGSAQDGSRICASRMFRHLWLGVSCEDQAAADARIPLLIQTPAAVRFLSLEPLLGPIDLARVLWGAVGDSAGYFDRNGRERSGGIGGQQMTARPRNWIHQIIVGGESGPGARPCEVEWIRSIHDQCKEARVPCFVKQDSRPRPGRQGRIPDDLWACKEFPA